MWVDWVRVYCGKPLPADFGKLKEYGVKGTVSVDFTDAAGAAAPVKDWEIAGPDAFAQKRWNRLDATEAKRKPATLVDSEGRTSPVKVVLAEDLKFAQGADWGFKGGDLRLHRGIVRGDVTVKNVPWRKWTLVVCLGADRSSWKGAVKLVKANGAVLAARDVAFGWDGGKYVEGSNTVVFKGLSAPSATLRLENGGGQGLPALAGLQFVPEK